MPKHNINKVSIRMYCMGTGDCFVLRFFAGQDRKFTMMVDCGSCSGTKEDFIPYIQNLKDYVGEGGIDLLIVSHEHQDHVNGFDKCKEIFKQITIKKAWFGWPEDPKDLTGRAKVLLEKRQKLRTAFANAKQKFIDKRSEIESNLSNDYYSKSIIQAHEAFLSGLNTLAEINLPADDETDEKASLAGMTAIRKKLEDDKVKIDYLEPGEIIKMEEAPGLTFYVLGPPWDRDAIFKDGKQGSDVYKKYFSSYQNMFSAEAYSNINNQKNNELPFDSHKYAAQPEQDQDLKSLDENYNRESWRKIDYDWIAGVGSLALRLNSHLNNTSLALAIEIGEGGNVLLFPGDAEFGNWESWHLIKKWEKKGKNGKHLSEDLLNRTVFYKVGHHLSYNGTALEKGIEMMPKNGMSSMASLDRSRISQNWKSTMPNKFLLQDLIKRCNGRVFIMNEIDIKNPPSSELDPQSVSHFKSDSRKLYKEYSLTF
jgi:beta-lactamase superfamily II metal-dependent hydrolase